MPAFGVLLSVWLSACFKPGSDKKYADTANLARKSGFLSLNGRSGAGSGSRPQPWGRRAGAPAGPGPGGPPILARGDGARGAWVERGWPGRRPDAKRAGSMQPALLLPTLASMVP